MSLVEQLKHGLDAPICLTWELTYACNLQCVHCLSSSGQRDPRELTTAEAKRVLDELRDLQVFYINIGGGEPMVRRDFFELVDYAVANKIGVKFSTNGAFIDPAKARRLAAMDYLDVQISLDGLDASTNDAVRGGGRLRTVQDQHRRHPPQRRPAERVQGARRRLRRPAACDPPAAERPWCRQLARSAPDERPAATGVPLVAGAQRPAPRPAGADRRQLLPPQRPRRAAAGSQHVRRRQGRLPDRPDR
jgi:organic radical activating enzyme